MNAQLPLALRWPAQQRFDTFVTGDNGVAVAALREGATRAGSPWIFLAGPPGSGKTHLLYATCAAATADGRNAQYLSLASLHGDRAAALRAFGGSDVLALDDVQAIAGAADAEHALFDLYNRSKTEMCTLILAARLPAATLAVRLPDLRSRLAACTQAPLKPLDEAARRGILRARAHARGLTLDAAALDWLFAHTPRDLGNLMTQLERVDRAALAAQRRVTIPFLRAVLDTDNGNAHEDGCGSF